MRWVGFNAQIECLEAWVGMLTSFRSRAPLCQLGEAGMVTDWPWSRDGRVEQGVGSRPTCRGPSVGANAGRLRFPFFLHSRVSSGNDVSEVLGLVSV